MKPKPIKLSKSDRDIMETSVKKIIGQLNSVLDVLNKNAVSEQTLNQLLAVKGGTNALCREIIAKGVLPNLKNYSEEQINHALNIIFKIS